MPQPSTCLSPRSFGTTDQFLKDNEEFLLGSGNAYLEGKSDIADTVARPIETPYFAKVSSRGHQELEPVALNFLDKDP